MAPRFIQLVIPSLPSFADRSSLRENPPAQQPCAAKSQLLHTLFRGNDTRRV